jgi:7-cyano-7-deazaguanine synthase
VKKLHSLVLATGGIDSTACIHFLQKQRFLVRALHIDFGQASATKEREALAEIAHHFGVGANEVVFASSESFGPGEIVGRNAFLIFAGLLYKQLDENLLVMGVHTGTPYFDCSGYFFDSIAKLVAEHTDSKTRVLAPFLNWTKQEIVEYSKLEKIPLQLTYSCERGTDPPCGQCLSCLDRRAFGC